MKTHLLLLLFSFFHLQSNAQCNETTQSKIILVGDSWAFFMNFDGTINQVAKDWGHSDVEYYTNLILSENGAETDDFLSQSKVSELSGKLASMPDLEAVHLSIGGNDFLGSWNIGYTQNQIDSLYEGVALRLDSIVAYIQQVRPDIHVFWSGYVYTNFGEVIGSISPSFLQAQHPFYGQWEDMGFPTFLQINSIQDWFQEKIRLRYLNNPNFTYIPASGLMQHVFGQASNLQVAPGGSYAALTAPMPSGYPDYPSPRNTMRDYGITKDCFHLSGSGYYAFISYHFQKFYHKYLMDDTYTIAEQVKTGSVSSTGTISNDLKVGKNGTEEYAAIIHLDNSHMDYYTADKLELFLKIEEKTGTDFLSSGEFEVDIVEGSIGSSDLIEAQDFQASMSVTATPCVFGNNSTGKWVRLDLPTTFNDFINVSQSQIRIRYTGQTDGVFRFVNTTDNDFQPVLNIKYGESTAGISNINNSLLTVFPNPANNFLNIHSESKIEHITVFSIAGQQMIDLNNPSNQISINGLSNGMYILTATVGGQTETIKFIKQ